MKMNNPEIKIFVPDKGNQFIVKALSNINNNKQITTLWRVANTNAITRLGMSDHGPVHVQIVANIALKLTRLLIQSKNEMSICKDYGLSNDYAELVVLLASLFHDLGISVSREGHEEYSLFICNSLIYQVLDFLPVEEATIVASEVLHAIISHRSDGHPLTLEAGIVRVADALDMSKGRSRIPYEAGLIGIYSVSASAIDEIEITSGIDKPIQINVTMNNSAGLFQLDELLKKKIKNSGLGKFLSVHACINETTEKKLITEYTI